LLFVALSTLLLTSSTTAVIAIEAKRKGIIPLLKPYIEILRQSKTHFAEELLN